MTAFTRDNEIVEFVYNESRFELMPIIRFLLKEI